MVPPHPKPDRTPKSSLRRAKSGIRSRACKLLGWWGGNFWSFVVGGLLSVGLSLLSIRGFLFGSGFYEYSDQQWAPNPEVYSPGYFSPSVLTSTGNYYSLQFTRDFVTWPIGLFHSLDLGALFQEKLFYLYSFALFVGLAYVLSALITHYVLRHLRLAPPRWKVEVCRILITLFVFTDLYFLYLNVDGGTVTDSLIGIFLGVSTLLIVAEDDFLKVFVVVVVLSSLDMLLDPANGVTVVLVLAVVLTLRSIARHESLRTFSKHIGGMLAAAIPVALFTLYVFYPTLGLGGAHSTYPLRPYSIAAIQDASPYTNLVDVLRLTGYSWSTLTFAPPSILAYNGSYQSLSAQQYPPAVLTMAGPLSMLWVASLYAPLCIAMGALLDRRLRSIVVPIAAVLVVSILLTQWPWIPPLAAFVTLLASIPYFGPLVAEALYFPSYFMLGEAVSIILLVGCLVTSIAAGAPSVDERPSGTMTRRTSVTPSTRTRRRRPLFRPVHRGVWRATAPTIIVVAIAAFMILPGWQALNGTYFPSRSWPTYSSGNGIPNAGPFEPIAIPSPILETYNYLYAQPGSFNIYWPTGGANASDTQRAAFFFSAFSAPKPMLGPLGGSPEVASLIANGETGSLVAYLESQNVRYFVLQNTSPVFLLQAYGLDNFTVLGSVLSSLLQFVPISTLNFPNYIETYEISGSWGPTYPVSRILSYTGPQPGSYPAAYAVGAELGSLPAVTYGGPATQTLSIDNLSGTQAILSPSGLENLTGVGAAANERFLPETTTPPTAPAGPFENLTQSEAASNETLTQAPGTTLNLSNWTVVNWGPSSVILSIDFGRITWSANGLTTVSLEFGPVITSGPGGTAVLTPSSNSSAVALRLAYRTSADFTGSLTAYLRDETTNESVASIPIATLLSPSSNITWDTFAGLTLPWTRYFQPCFQSTFSAGSIEVMYANTSWNHRVVNASYHVDYPSTALGAWTLTNWSGRGPQYYTLDGGLLNVNSPVSTATFSLNYGPLLATGGGGVPNPGAGGQAVTVTMHVSYRMAPGFTASLVNLAAIYQTSKSPTASAIGVNGPTLPFTTSWGTASYTIGLSAATRNFTVRLQVIGFQGSIDFSNITFAWAWLPVKSSAPFGTLLSIEGPRSLSFPSRYGTAAVELTGPSPLGGRLISNSTAPEGFQWYLFPATFVQLSQGDQVAIVALNALSANGAGPIATVDTGPFSVDLVLKAGGRTYTPFETIDGDSLFSYSGSGGFEVVHSAVGYVTAYYIALLIYLAILYPILNYRRRHRSGRACSGETVQHPSKRLARFDAGYGTEEESHDVPPVGDLTGSAGPTQK